MNYYKETTIFENSARLSDLITFRNLLIDYFDEIDYDIGEPIVSDRGSQIRSEINKLSPAISMFVRASGIHPEITYYPPAALGGYVTEVDLISNIFNLSQYRIAPQHAIDVLEKSIGMYESDKQSALLRTFNPFFWLMKFVGFVTSIPFKILDQAGFNGQKIKQTPLGKIISLISQLIFLAGTFLTILQVLGYAEILKSIKQFIDSVI